MSWTGALGAGESVELSYTVTVEPGGDGIVRNVAWEPEDPQNPVPPECDPPEEGADPDTGEPCAQTEHLLPRLTVTKTADRAELPAVGESVEYTITVTNDGPGAYTADSPATLTDDLEDVLDAATFNNDATATTGEVSYDEPTLSWQGALEAGASATITYSVTYTGEADQNLRNLACVPESETAPDEASCDAVQIPGAGLTAWKQVDSSDEPAVAGSVLTYTLFFANDGEATATVDHIDDLAHVSDDADITSEPTSTDGLLVSRDGNQIAITGDVPAGQTRTATYQVTVKPDGQRGDDIAANFLLVNDPDNPPTPPEEPVCNPTDTEFPDCTSTPIGAVEYTKNVTASSDPVAAGTVLTYTITVTNTGQATAPLSREDVLTDVLDDAELTSVPESDTDSVTISDVAEDRFQIGGELAAGETATITYQATVNADTERGNNTADNFLVTPGDTPPAECEDGATDCTTTPLPQVEASKSSDPESGSSVTADQEVTYTLTFANTGEAAGAVDYTDHLTDVLDDAVLTAGPTASNQDLTAITEGETIRITGTVPAGAVHTVNYTVTVNAYDQQGNHQLNNVIAVTGEEPVCVDDSSLCTEHEIPEPPALPTPPQEPGGNLPNTGADTTTVLLATLLLLGIGAGMTHLARRRKNTLQEPSQKATLGNLM
ncbi:LPXTG cell wall anchor domain-containing protein [Ruania alba]|uniref:LPXTG-motif cell wall anchor domain-containing protein/conserved repeat domain-containing protein/fimbrial isopeptide formation D2 domain-containing protein n=1 Tax=Ruania alba TaxID=648782 RepID=A0A1H5GNT8_9MICO|nr:LPXTG cell wall anchor domain-containing protein [Ruania alba]SEE17369.1 LPXTG-motif cell wall anchor domain-containing protein/conserved repeat domain-containing protein/fimbrial isopeptide formation D2 domain-containing protein [Ruania alba]SEE87420.1 LPXTG-motif cell wall anchor domain-containing protein/conserved repeat domain-containing protein/fimbrial isopeptide formation D2 domain-containing protein [Ruania alba]